MYEPSNNSTVETQQFQNTSNNEESVKFNNASTNFSNVAYPTSNDYSNNYYYPQQNQYPFLSSDQYYQYYNFYNQAQYPQFYYQQQQPLSDSSYSCANNYYQNSTQSQNFPSEPTQRPVTPPSSSYSKELQANSGNEKTPEKPVMNDSGIDSPHITFLHSTPAFYQHQQNYSTLSSSSQSSNSAYLNFQSVNNNSNQSTSQNETKKEQEEKENNDESVEEDEDDDEEEAAETNKENKKSSASDPAKPPKPYLEIIADSILSSKMRMMQLHEIYHVMEKKFDYFAKNVNKSWRNSVRHNLSLNECFVKAGRGSNGKGNYWKIHPLCEKEFIRGNFRRKSFKQLIRAGSANSHRTPFPQSNMILPIPSNAQYPFNYANLSSISQVQTDSSSYPVQFSNSLLDSTNYQNDNKRQQKSRFHPYSTV